MYLGTAHALETYIVVGRSLGCERDEGAADKIRLFIGNQPSRMETISTEVDIIESGLWKPNPYSQLGPCK